MYSTLQMDNVKDIKSGADNSQQESWIMTSETLQSQFVKSHLTSSPIKVPVLSYL